MEKIRVETLVNADLKKVWEYFTTPEHVMNWNFASSDWHCPAASNNLVTGGSFSYTMAAKDGSFSFDFAGVYDEVIEKEQFTYSMADGRQVQVIFEEQDGGVLVTEIFDPESENPVEMQQAGWQMILDNFRKYTESHLS
jgi:uncharacterized protein YndB with AHSA1/START domain